MSDTIPKDAFCLLLWAHNGGHLDRRYVPSFHPENETADDPTVGIRVRGYCEHATDCCDFINNKICDHLAEELGHHPAEEIGWLCPECATDVARWAKDLGIGRVLWGHYAEGYCQNPSCWMISRTGMPKYSILLQLVLGPWRRRFP